MKYLELKIPPPFLIFITAMLMSGIAYLGFLPMPIPLLPRCVFFSLTLLVGGVFLVWSVKLFNAANTTWFPVNPEKATALVTTGIYQHSRNPMYLFWAVILLGFGVLLGDYLGMILVPLFMLYMTRFQIIPEEQALEKLFGEEYRNYKMQVRRW